MPLAVNQCDELATKVEHLSDSSISAAVLITGIDERGNKHDIMIKIFCNL